MERAVNVIGERNGRKEFLTTLKYIVEKMTMSLKRKYRETHA